ncbi:MAG: FtsX-like permease family protein [Candidatus Hodarchaeales archaeon]|jgi:ABC-type lipoprotein release transport system permease subunit
MSKLTKLFFAITGMLLISCFFITPLTGQELTWNDKSSLRDQTAPDDTRDSLLSYYSLFTSLLGGDSLGVVSIPSHYPASTASPAERPSVYINGSLNDPSGKPVPGMLLFLATPDPVSAGLEFSQILTFTIFSPFIGQWEFDSTNLQNPLASLQENDFIVCLALGQVQNSSYIWVSNLHYFGPVVDGFTINNYNITLVPSSLFIISGISHINSSVEENMLMSTGYNASAFSYEVIEPEKGTVILEQRYFFMSFLAQQGLRDFMFYLPVNYTQLNVNFYYYSREFGWINSSREYNTQGYFASNVTFHLLTLDLAKRGVELIEGDINYYGSLGYNFDVYRPEIEEIKENYNQAITNWENSTPGFGFDIVELDESGNTALFNAELTILKAVHLRELFYRQYLELTRENIDAYLVVTISMAAIASLVIPELVISGQKRYKYVTSSVLFINFFLLLGFVNPRANVALAESFQVLFVKLPIFLVVVAIVMVTFAIIYLFTLPSSFRRTRIINSMVLFVERIEVLFNLGLRNLKRRKLRTTTTLLTLVLVVSSFILLVSVSFHGQVTMSRGESTQSRFDGIKIKNYDEGMIFFTPYVAEQRIASRAEVMVNVTIEAHGLRETIPVALRDWLVRSTMPGRGQLDTLYSNPNLTLTNRLTNRSRSIYNYFATTPSSEANISKIDNSITRGRWLDDWFNVTDLSKSEVVISEELAINLGVDLGDSIDYVFNVSGFQTETSLKVVGFFDPIILEWQDIDNKSFGVEKTVRVGEEEYEYQGYCNSTDFIFINFNWWRLARAKTIDPGMGFFNIPQTSPAQIIVGSSDLELGKDLKNGLTGLDIYLTADGQFYSLEYIVDRRVEGIISQIIPLAIAFFIVSQIIFNSIWERKEEMKIYFSLGSNRAYVSAIILAEYTLLGLLAGCLGYFSGLILFPAIKMLTTYFQLNLALFLTQKTDSSFALVSVFISVVICILGTLPVIYKVSRELGAGTEEKERDQEEQLPMFIHGGEIDRYFNWIKSKKESSKLEKKSNGYNILINDMIAIVIARVEDTENHIISIQADFGSFEERKGLRKLSLEYKKREIFQV